MADLDFDLRRGPKLDREKCPRSSHEGREERRPASSKRRKSSLEGAWFYFTCPAGFRASSLDLLPWSQRLSFILSWQILRREPLLFFLLARSARAHWFRPLGSSLSCHQLLTVVSDWRIFFNCSTSHMIGWIKYLWRCDWSKEIFDSCQVLSQHESEILNDLDQRLSFLSVRRFDQRLASQTSK